MTGPQPPNPENWPTQPPASGMPPQQGGGYQGPTRQYQAPQQGYQPPPPEYQAPPPGYQPPPPGYQAPPPGYQPPPPGYQVPPQGYPPQGYQGTGQAGAPKSGRRIGWIIAAVVVVLAGGGIFAAHALSGTSKGSIVLPARLLGLDKATGSGANGLARELMQAETRGAGNKLKNVKAGVYGTPTAAWLAVAGGGICGTCSPKSASALTDSLKAQGYTRAASFPPGPKGGILACGSKPVQTSLLYRCSWVDDKTAGDILYSGGSASALADAATKTNQVRSAIEH